MVDHGGLMHGVTLSAMLQHRFSVVCYSGVAYTVTAPLNIAVTATVQYPKAWKRCGDVQNSDVITLR